MRRILSIMAIALVASFGAAVMAEEDGAAETTAVTVTKAAAKTNPATCEADAIGELEFIAALKKEVGSFTVRPCPELQNCSGGTVECGGNAHCGATLNVYDLRIRACDDNGQQMLCPPGQSVHVEAGRCNACPCCSSSPLACACPADGCNGRAIASVFCQ